MFKVDLAIRSEHDSIYRLGLLVDGRAYYEQGDLLERDMMRPKLLRDFGWRVAIVLGIDWYQDGPAVKAKILDLLGSPHPDEPDAQR